MSVRTVGITIKQARLAKKSRNPRLWSRKAVIERACDVAGRIYGEAAPDIDENWLWLRESSAASIMETDIPKLIAVARVLDLDVNALFLSMLR